MTDWTKRAVSQKTLDLVRLLREDAITRKFGMTCLGVVGLMFLVFLLAEIFDQRSRFAVAVIRLIALNDDGGFAELLGYGAAFIAAANFLVLYLDHRRRSLLFVVLLISFIGIDDSLSYHEGFGRHLVVSLDLQGYFGLRAQDTGEILAWSLAAFFLGFVFLWSLASLDSEDLAMLLVLAMPMALLGVCGVVLDMFHILASGRSARFIGVAEDGGELLALTMIAIFSVGMYRNAPAYFGSHDRLPVGRR